MSVTLRCPSCGTTRDAPGECDACHDAEVRYFCDAHVPGAWLKGRTCERCGASFGESPRERPIATPVAPPALPRPKTIRPPAPAERPPVIDERPYPWHRLLDAAARARYSPETELAAPPDLSQARTVVGCLLRLAFIAVLLFVALVVAAFFLARSVLPDLGGF